MRKNSTFSNWYLALLLIELGVVTYDGLFTDSSFGQWVRVIVLALAVLGFYNWKRSAWRSPRWAWRTVFVLVCGWFVVYLPLEIYRDWHLMQKIIDEFGLTVVVPGYLFFYAFHLPLLYVLYSSAFRDPAVPSNSAAALDA